jgi:hypothetical protein
VEGKNPRAMNQREQVAVSCKPPAHAGSSLVDFLHLEDGTIRSSETSVNKISAQRHIPEDDILKEMYIFYAALFSCFAGL